MPSALLASATNRWRHSDIVWVEYGLSSRSAGYFSLVRLFLCETHSWNTRIAQLVDLAVFAGITPFDDFMTSDSVSVTLNCLEGDDTWCFLFSFPFARVSFAFLVSNRCHHLLHHQHYWVFAASSVPYYHLSPLFHNSYTLGVLDKRVNCQDNVGNQPSRLACSIPSR